MFTISYELVSENVILSITCQAEVNRLLGEIVYALAKVEIFYYDLFLCFRGIFRKVTTEKNT